MKETDEAILVAELKEGKQAAFKELVEKYQKKVYNAGLSFLHNSDDAEDVSQEVFMEIYRSIARFRGDSTLNTWIYRIAVNKCLEFIRRKKMKKRFAFVATIFGESGEEKEPAEFNHPGVQLEDKEKAQTLFQAIGRLAENQKTAFILHHLEGLSYQEISDTMKLSLSAVESLLFRAKKNLRQGLYNYFSK